MTMKTGGHLGRNGMKGALHLGQYSSYKTWGRSYAGIHCRQSSYNSSSSRDS